MKEITTASNSVEQAQVVINSELLKSYITYLDTSQKTAETYERCTRQFIKYLADRNITQPARADILEYKEHLQQQGYKASTQQIYITSVKLLFKWTAQQGIYPNIAEHIKGVKISAEHKKDILTSEQVKEVLNSVDQSTLKGSRDYALILLMVTTGLRTIEVSRANVGDLRAKGNDAVLYVQGKGREDKAEHVRVPGPVATAIYQYLARRKVINDDDPLFASVSNHNSNERLTTRSISRIVKGRFKAVGLDSDRLTAHSLRHTAITLALLQGESLEDVQMYARHKNINTTMIYNHAIELERNTCSNSICDLIM